MSLEIDREWEIEGVAGVIFLSVPAEENMSAFIILALLLLEIMLTYHSTY